MAKSRVAILLLLAIAITIFFFWVIQDFALALVMAAVLAGLARPIHHRLCSVLGGRKGIAAMLMVVLAVAIVIVPFLLLMGVLLHDAVQISDGLEPWIAKHLQNPENLQRAIEESPTLRKLLPYQDEILQKAGELASRVASFLAQAVVGTATGTARFFLMLFVMLYAMFYFLKEGPAILDTVFAYTPLSAGDQERLVATFTSVARATLRGTVLIGIAQGALGGVAFAVVGIEGAVFWGAIMAVLSIVPGVGTGLVWVPAVIYLAVIDRLGAAAGLAVWCAVVVGTADTVLRPLLVGKDIKMPDLMVLLTTLGGLALFGIAGMVIGPIVGALFTTAWTLWGTAVREAGFAIRGANAEAADPGG
jgi:predicted PurR-regulated permease PerM